MITRIFAQGFKGLDFDQSLALRTVITGRIGSGKSSRALALALLVTGSLPGTGIAKSNSDILNAVGNGDSLTVGVEFDDGVTLERSYKRKKTTRWAANTATPENPFPKTCLNWNWIAGA